MNEEELEKTGVLKEVLDQSDEEELTIDEMLEEFLEGIDFMNITDERKKKLREMALKVQQEKNTKTKEKLFSLLKKEANES